MGLCVGAMLVSCHSLVGRATTWHEILIWLCIFYTNWCLIALSISLVLCLPCSAGQQLPQPSWPVVYLLLFLFLDISSTDFYILNIQIDVSVGPGGWHSFHGPPPVVIQSKPKQQLMVDIPLFRKWRLFFLLLFFNCVRPSSYQLTSIWTYLLSCPSDFSIQLASLDYRPVTPDAYRTLTPSVLTGLSLPPLESMHHRAPRLFHLHQMSTTLFE